MVHPGLNHIRLKFFQQVGKPDCVGRQRDFAALAAKRMERNVKLLNFLSYHAYICQGNNFRGRNLSRSVCASSLWSIVSAPPDPVPVIMWTIFNVNSSLALPLELACALPLRSLNSIAARWRACAQWRHW